MFKLSQNVKAWIAASLISLFLYNAYWTVKSYENFLGYIFQVQPSYNYVSTLGFVFWGGHIGLTARFAAIVIGLTVTFLLWAKRWSFLKVKKLVATALVLEGVNFLGLLPSTWWMLRLDSFVYSPALGVGYLIQILFTTPLLWFLATKILRYNTTSIDTRLWKWVGITFMSYIIALFSNEFSRWISMISLDNLVFLIEGIRVIGFFNASVIMPIAVVLAFVAAFYTAKHNMLMLPWVGASLAVTGLHYALYVVYSYFTNSMNYALLVDVWTLPLLGLGLTLLFNYGGKTFFGR